MQHILFLLLSVSLLGTPADSELREEQVQEWRDEWSARIKQGEPGSVEDLVSGWRDLLDEYAYPHLVPGWPDWIEQWRPLVVEYFPPEDVELAMAVIACESSGDSKAVNPKSGATGLFHHLPGYWSVRSYYAGVPGASIRNPEASTAVAVWLAYNTPNTWNHWSCARHMDW